MMPEAAVGARAGPDDPRQPATGPIARGREPAEATEVLDDAHPPRDRRQPWHRDRSGPGPRPPRPPAPARADRRRGRPRRVRPPRPGPRTRPGPRPRPPRPRPAERIGPQYADILAAHARMIDDPTLRRDARDRIERDLVSAEHAVSEVLEGHAARLAGLSRLPPGRPGRRRPRHPAAHPRPVPRPGDRPGPGRHRGADRRPGARPLAQRDRRARPGMRARLRHRERRAGQPHRDRRRRPGDPRRRRPGPGSSTSPGSAGPPSSTATRGWSSSTPTPRPWTATAGPPSSGPPGSQGLADLAHLPAETLDGQRRRALGQHRVPRRGRPLPRAEGPPGIGLYRTEFLFLNADRPPTEDEQFAAYRGRGPLGPRAGPSRSGPSTSAPTSSSRTATATRPSPTRRWACGASGSRSATRDLFRTQLRAILRASALGDVRVMFPLVSTLDRIPPGPGDPRRGRRRAGRRGGRRPAPTCPSA